MNQIKQRRPLMGTDNILDLQNNGYKNSVYAIAEIIDNSIQANSEKIDVIIINDTLRHSSNIRDIYIIDNGEGMGKAVFEKALMMNSGTRGSAKSGLGKYGQGLPNASISQTKRVEAYTFQENIFLYNYIDLEEIFESKDPFLPEIENKDSIDIDFINKVNYNLSDSGTIIRWVEPNNIKPKTTSLLVENINKLAGRIFRHYLNGFQENGKTIKTELNIIVYDYNGENYDFNSAHSILKVKPFDPMFLMSNTQMNSEFKIYNHPTSEIYGKKDVKEFDITVFNRENKEEKVKTKVELIFSHVKTEEKYRESRSKPGDTDFGKIYKKRNIPHTRGYNNISIVRAKREIDNGDYGFIGDVSDPTLRWWSVEIRTEADLDTIIGIDNKKQQASNIRFLDKDDQEYDSHEVLIWISETVYANIRELKKIIEGQYHYQAPETKLLGVEDGGTDPITPIGPTEPGDDEKPFEEDPTDQDKKDLFKWIKKRYDTLTDKEIDSRVNWALSISDKYIFVYSDLGETALYSYTTIPGIATLIEINYNHSFYKEFMSKLEEESENSHEDKKIRTIRLLISSLVKAELTNKTEDKSINKFLKRYKNSMAISLDEYIDDLFSN